MQAETYQDFIRPEHPARARQLINLVASQLVVSARLDARWLIGLALGEDMPIMGHEDIALSSQQAAKLAGLITARNAGQPLSRMRGKKEFWSLDFYLNAATLDPRPDSEVLVAAALSFAQKQSLGGGEALTILDIGTGTGCLLLSLLSELPMATGIGIDLAPLAVAQARANAARLNLADRADIQTGNWAHMSEGVFARQAVRQFDIIICNPPYICAGDSDLAVEVTGYDPALALYAGEDGLDSYKALLPALMPWLKTDGQAFIELGWGQYKPVSFIANMADFTCLDVKKDLAGIHRCLIIGR